MKKWLVPLVPVAALALGGLALMPALMPTASAEDVPSQSLREQCQAALDQPDRTPSEQSWLRTCISALRPGSDSTSAPAPSPTTRTTPSSTPTTSQPSNTEQTIRAYITGYSWFDNTPPGSADIALPVLHSKAGGTGTYEDPTTVAVGHVISGGKSTPDWPQGTRFYIPNLHRYFIVEDVCGDGPTPQNGPCHTGYPSSASTWLDVWVGGQGGSAAGADACMNSITKVSSVIVDPKAGYPVTSGDIYKPSGCTQQYGDSL